MTTTRTTAEAALPRILCVDDSRAMLVVLKRVFRRRFDVVVALSGVEALSRLGEDGPFSVVVCDLEMPEMDGAELLEHMRQRAPDSVRILLTATEDLSGAADAINRGAIFRFVRKSCESEQLIRHVEDAVGQYRLVTADAALIQRRVEELTAQLVTAERLATLGTLANGLAHELSNVASVLVPVVHEIRHAAEAGERPFGEDIQALSRVTDHIVTHVKQMRRLGGTVSDPVAQVDLCGLAADTLAMLRISGKTKHIDVALVLPPHGVHVMGSRTRLEQVLVNLVGNAADAVREAHERGGGELVVTLSHCNESRQATIDIRDNGCGIAEDKLSSIFEAYFTTKPPGKGTGLGLPVVRTIVEKHKGSLEVASVVGQGSTFSVRLPLA